MSVDSKSAAVVDKPTAVNSTGFVLTEQTGNLFDITNESIGHCVSKCLKMSAGIATGFRTKFGRIDELKSQNAAVGDIAVLNDGNRFIYYLVTKNRYFEKPTMAAVRSSLEAMRRHAVSNDVRRLSMPRIGCGLDRLSWPAIRSLIVDIFRTTPIRVTIYVM